MSSGGRDYRMLVLVMALSVLAASIGFGAWRVVRLERHELLRRTSWQSVRDAPTPAQGPDAHLRRRIAAVEVRGGESVEVELCGGDALRTGMRRGEGAVEVWLDEPRRRVLATPLERRLAAHARHTPRGLCVVTARARELPRSGRFSVELAWRRDAPPELGPLRVRVATWNPLTSVDRATVLVTLLGGLLLWVAFVLPPPRDPLRAELKTSSGAEAENSSRAPPNPMTRLTVGVVALVSVGSALSFMPWSGSAYGMVQGFLLAAVQLVLAVALLPGAPSRVRALALQGPVRPSWALLLAPIAGAGIRPASSMLTQLVPSTTEAPIQTFASMPSGMLALTLVAVVVPLAEETFFRGFVYGLVAQRVRPWGAVLTTTLLFAAAHVPQLWGSWGALSSIFVTGLVLTVLRRWFGSVLVPALAHMTHNAVIVVGTIGT